MTGLAWAAERAFDPTTVSEQEAAYQRGHLRTHFGSTHAYYAVLDWTCGRTGWTARYGADAKRAVAFLPQASGRFMLTRAAQRFESEVQATLRLFLHDECLGLCPQEQLDSCLQNSQQEMERPVPELGGLVVRTEAKAGPVWGAMKKVSS